MSGNSEKEKTYREGYSQGANAAVEAFAKGTASVSDINLMRNWVKDLYDWRYAGTNELIVPPQPPLGKRS